MLNLSKLRIFLFIVTSLFLLGACNGGDVEMSASSDDGKGEAISLENIERAEGVIYQDAFYN